MLPDSEAYMLVISKLDDNLLWHEAVHVFWRSDDIPLDGTTKGRLLSGEIVGRWMAQQGPSAVQSAIRLAGKEAPQDRR